MTGTIPAMHMIRSALAGLLALLTASAAVAQTFPTVPGRSVIGRLGILGDTGPSQAIPLTTLQAQILGLQTANKVNAGPASGAAAFPTFRSLVGADLPAPGAASLGGVQSITCSTSNWFRTLSTSGVFGCSQPAVSDLTGFGTGVATFLATPSSANLISAVTDETGTGALVFASTPTLVTPVLGAAIATSVNKVVITAPASSATLTIPDGVTLTGPAASGTAMTLGNVETVTGVKTFGSAGAVSKLAIAGTTSGSTVLNASATASGTLTLPAATDTLVGLATTDTFTGVKTFGAAGNVGKLVVAGTTSGTTVLNATAVASGTLTLPAATDTLMGKATTDVLTNKTLNSTGTGNVLQVSGVTVSAGQYPGEPTTGSATAGNVGEYQTTTLALGSAISLSTGVTSNIITQSLTAGDWDVRCGILFRPAATTNYTFLNAGVSLTSATLPTTDGLTATQIANASGVVIGNVSTTAPVVMNRFSLSTTTNVFCAAQATFTVSTMTAYGMLQARRMR